MKDSKLKATTYDLTHKILEQDENKLDNLYLYNRIIGIVEAGLFEAAIHSKRYNQSKAARFLGISRATLRKKLVLFFGDKYVGNYNDRK